MTETLLHPPGNRPAPPPDLTPSQREVFTILTDLAVHAAGLRGVALIPSDGLGLTWMAEWVVLAQEWAKAGRLVEAAELAEVAQELADRYWIVLPASLLPSIGRA